MLPDRMLSCSISTWSVPTSYCHVHGKASKLDLPKTSRILPMQPDVAQKDGSWSKTSNPFKQGDWDSWTNARSCLQKELGRHYFQAGWFPQDWHHLEKPSPTTYSCGSSSGSDLKLLPRFTKLESVLGNSEQDSGSWVGAIQASGLGRLSRESKRNAATPVCAHYDWGAVLRGRYFWIQAECEGPTERKPRHLSHPAPPILHVPKLTDWLYHTISIKHIAIIKLTDFWLIIILVIKRKGVQN